MNPEQLLETRLQQVRKLTGNLTLPELCLAIRELLCASHSQPTKDELAEIYKLLLSSRRCKQDIKLNECLKNDIDIHEGRDLSQGGVWRAVY